MARFRIRELLDETKKTGKRVTQKQLAEAAGISQASVSDIVNGLTKAPQLDVLITFAEIFTKALGRIIVIEDFYDRERPNAKRLTSQINRSLDAFHDSDLNIGPIRFSRVSELKEIPDGDLDKANESHIVTRHIMYGDVPKGVFLIRAPDNAMSPIICQGDLLTIDEFAKPEKRDIVLAYIHNTKELVIRQIFFDIDGWVLLAPKNDQYDPHGGKPGEHVKIIGKVMRVTKDFDE